MKQSTWAFLTLLALAAVGCASGGRLAPSDTPEPATSPETDATPASIPQGIPDTLPTPSPSPRDQAAPRVNQNDVQLEVQQLFGNREASDLDSDAASWDIPITVNDAVERWLDYFQGDGRKNFAIYLSRAGRYEPMMRAIFRDAGLPEDLVYLSLIESGFSPRAYSRARAVGLWQFISSTGRLYGLDISYWVDERRDPILATKAAAAHLKDLYDDFGSWYLAAAAYNGGAARVRRSINRSGTDDFWTLARRRYLRRETRNYVPKLIAAALIAKQPDHYGFYDVETADPIAYDIVQVPDATSLDVIADAAHVSEKAVAELNPQVLRGVTPPGKRYTVRVPPGTGQMFAADFATVPPKERVRWVRHVVRRGDTLSEIARLYGVSVSSIRAANRHVSPRRLRIGQSLVIPRAGRVPQLASRASRRSSSRRHTSPVRPEGSYITYRVQSGDTLWAIARRYDVSARDLMRWNGLRTSRIYPGDEVRVYVGTD